MRRLHFRYLIFIFKMFSLRHAGNLLFHYSRGIRHFSSPYAVQGSKLPEYFTEEIVAPHLTYDFLVNKVRSDLITEMRVIKVRLLKCQTGIEKRRQYSVALAVGNGKGGLGYALGKDRSPVDAMQKATKAAERAMTHYEMYANRTIFHEDTIKYRNTTIVVRPMPPDSGVRAHWAIQELCRCLGLKDLSAKVYGSRTAINVANGFILALSRQKTPEMIARDSGMKIVDVLKIFNSGAKFIESSKWLLRRQVDGARTLRNQIPMEETTTELTGNERL